MMTLLDEHSFRAVAVPGAGIPVVAVTDEGLGNTSWVVDVGDGRALVVDPERDPRPYLAVADRLDAEVALAVETHLHADFVTGSPELAAHGAEVVASAAGALARAHRGVADGDVVDLGRWRLETMATPGHTPEHVAYVLADDGGARAVFTGGSLLVGAVARTDLIDPAETEGLTRALWQSIHGRLLTLDDDVLVLPTHGAGSFCSAAGDGRRWTTIGDERRANPLLAAPDEDAFVRQVLGDLGTFPPYFLRMREVNRLGPPVFGGVLALGRLEVSEVAAAVERGAVVVDVRPVPDFAGGHLVGSLANTLRPQFASFLSWTVPDPATELVFVTDHHTDRRELVRQCLNIGYEHLAGELVGGVEAWAAAGGEVTSTPLLDVGALGGRTVIDVRQGAEFAAGHLPGAVHRELGQLARHAADLPAGPAVVMCGHGERAATAASVLASVRPDVAIMNGGPDGWAATTGNHLERG